MRRWMTKRIMELLNTIKRILCHLLLTKMMSTKRKMCDSSVMIKKMRRMRTKKTMMNMMRMQTRVILISNYHLHNQVLLGNSPCQLRLLMIHTCKRIRITSARSLQIHYRPTHSTQIRSLKTWLLMHRLHRRSSIQLCPSIRQHRLQPQQFSSIQMVLKLSTISTCCNSHSSTQHRQLTATICSPAFSRSIKAPMLLTTKMQPPHCNSSSSCKCSSTSSASYNSS